MGIKVLSGRLVAPMRLLIHGYPKVGKTTAASELPDPLFISGESGDGQLNVKRFLFDERSQRYWPQKWDEVLTALVEIGKDPNGFKSIVFDGFGAMEKLAITYVCTQNKWQSIGSPGYGKGEAALLAEVQKFLRLVEDVWAKGVNVAFVSHSTISKVKTPSGDDYPRYAPALTSVNNGDVAGLLVGWCDAVLFAQVEVSVATKEKKTIGVGTGRHVFKTRTDAQWVAGCRYGNVPEVMDLSMVEFLRLVSEGQDAKAMTAKIKSLASELGEETLKNAEAFLASPAAKDVTALCRSASILSAQVEEKRAA